MYQRAQYRYPLFDSGKKLISAEQPPLSIREMDENQLDYVIFFNRKSAFSGKGFYLVFDCEEATTEVELYFYFDATSPPAFFKRITHTQAPSDPRQFAYYIDVPMLPYALWVKRDVLVEGEMFTVYME